MNPEEIQAVRVLFDPSNMLSDAQIKVFLEIAKEKKLDPRLKQICAIPKHNKNTGRTECVTITQIDGFRLIAERTQKYAPGRETSYAYDSKGHLISATAYVKKMTSDGTWHEVSESAYLAEYKPKNAYPSSPWNTMPHVMIAKCAEARALRRAFPGEMSGIYSKEELDQADEIVPQEIRPKELIHDFVDEKTVAEMEAFCAKRPGLKEESLKICGVSSFEKLKTFQLQSLKKLWEKRKEQELELSNERS